MWSLGNRQASHCPAEAAALDISRPNRKGRPFSQEPGEICPLARHGRRVRSIAGNGWAGRWEPSLTPKPHLASVSQFQQLRASAAERWRCARVQCSWSGRLGAAHHHTPMPWISAKSAVAVIGQNHSQSKWRPGHERDSGVNTAVNKPRIYPPPSNNTICWRNSASPAVSDGGRNCHSEWTPRSSEQHLSNSHI